jgi:ATP-dependent Clp protease ATP-binding subunit ClpX
MNNEKVLTCSFCSAAAEDRRFLVAGPKEVMICDQCVEECIGVLFNKMREATIIELKKP